MVSVCMATKNGARYIRQQIDSILPQLSADDELVISDDASGDATSHIIDSYPDDRIRFFRHERPVGISKNFEFALKASAGEFIFLADQDDVWFPEKIPVMSSYLDNYDLVISDCMVADEDLQAQHPSFFLINNSGSGFIRNLFRNSYMGCCMAFKKEVLKKAIPFPNDIRVHDFWIGLIGEWHFRVHFIKRSLMYHRRHEANASTTGAKSNLPLHIRLMTRYNTIMNVVKR